MNIGLIGAGAIGNYLLKYINGENHGNMTIKNIFVRNYEKYKHLEEKYDLVLHTDFNEFIKADTDVIVEVANVQTAKDLLPKVIVEKEVMLISIGALADEELLQKMAEGAHQLHLPSGGIGGLDLIQNAKALGNLNQVSLTTRKPAASLVDEKLDEEKIVFEGKAKDAIDKFPKNMNVSIILSLAGLGIDQTEVVLIANPHADKNTHTINASGDFGEMEISIKNNPLPENPKTSSLAALSVFASLERMAGNIKIGS